MAGSVTTRLYYSVVCKGGVQSVLYSAAGLQCECRQSVPLTSVSLSLDNATDCFRIY